MKFKKSFSILLLIVTFLINIQTCLALSIANITDALDFASCLRWAIVGYCKVGYLILHYRPELIIETVKNPGDTSIDEYSGSVKSYKPSMKIGADLNLPITSGTTSHSQGQWAMQFNEVRVYRFPINTALENTPYWCRSWEKPGIHYISEADSTEWRTGMYEFLSWSGIIGHSLSSSGVCGVGTAVEDITKSSIWSKTFKLKQIHIPFLGEYCMGSWGPIFPRVGFLIHQSEIVGSAADAFRAVHIASHIEKKGEHVVIRRITDFRASVDADSLQLVHPSSSGCIDIGEIPAWWEQNKTSKSGKYVWIYWRPILCCKVGGIF